MHTFLVEIGSTGDNSAKDTLLRFDPDLLDAAHTVKVLGAARQPRKFSLNKEGRGTVLLESLEVGTWTTVSLTWVSETGKPVPAVDDVLLSVEPAQGSVVQGSPRARRFYRFLISIYRLVSQV